MQSRVVLDSLLALSGVQSWANGSFAMGDAMLYLRQKALQGCQALLQGLGGEHQIPQGMDNIYQRGSKQAGTTGHDNIFSILASCALLFLYEKLTGEVQGHGNCHLQFFARLFSGGYMTTSIVTRAEFLRTEAFQFFSSFFRYNDIVRSTSSRRPTLLDFYPGEVTESNYDNTSKTRNETDKEVSRLAFPQLITRISDGDLTITDSHIVASDGILDWLPSFSLLPALDLHKHAKLPLWDQELIVSSTYGDLASFSCPGEWDERELVSELYRITAMIYRRQCVVRHCLVNGQVIPEELQVGNLVSWAVQLVQLLPHGSLYENTLLWPIGIIARELKVTNGTEREYIISKLYSLEDQFHMRHFARARQYLIKYWKESDQGVPHEDNDTILIG